MASETGRMQRKQRIKQAVQNVVLPACYFLFRWRRIDPRYVVFADAHHTERPAEMALLYEQLRREGTWRIEETYLDYGTAGALAVAGHSISFMHRYAGAGFVILCDNFLPAASCRKKRGTKVVQLWHACGSYKKFGYDAPDDIPRDYRGGNVYRNTDLVTVSGRAAAAPFASAMRLPRRCVQPLGVSRTDLLLRADWQAQCRARFAEAYPQAAGKKVVLWAPTFRGNAGAPEGMQLDLNALQRALGEEVLVLARPHPHMLHGAQGERWQAEQGTHFCTLPTEALYPVADVLIADYSSLIYEYLLFRKPLLLYVPDLEAYRAQRGFYMDIEQIPSTIVREEAELAGAIKDALKKQKETPRDAFLARYMGACDGRATERIARWMHIHVTVRQK